MQRYRLNTNSQMMRVMPHLIIVTWSNHLAANAGDGSAGKRAVGNTAKTFCTQCIYNT